MVTWRRETSQANGTSQALPLLLYRYFFFDWLFRDASRGSLLERAAASRFNRQMRHYLPVYLLRWVIVVVFSYGLGEMFESWLTFAHAATFCYFVTSMSVAMALLIVRSWLGLKYG